MDATAWVSVAILAVFLIIMVIGLLGKRTADQIKFFLAVWSLFGPLFGAMGAFYYTKSEVERAQVKTAEALDKSQKIETQLRAYETQAKADAEAAISGADQALAACRMMLSSAPKGVVRLVNLAAMTGDLEAAQASIDGAKADMNEERFFESKKQAIQAKETAEVVCREVQAAIEGRKGTTR